MTIRAAFTTCLVILIGVTLAACKPTGGAAGTARDTALSALSPEAQKALSPESNPLVPVRYIMEAYKAGADIVFLDARTPVDYSYGHIPGAIDVPFFEAEKHIGQLAKDRLYITYCECPHAEAVSLADTLRAKGFTHVKTIDEGLYGWQQAGGELVASEGAPVLPVPGGTRPAGTPGTAPAVNSASTPSGNGTSTAPAPPVTTTPGGG